MSTTSVLLLFIFDFIVFTYSQCNYFLVEDVGEYSSGNVSNETLGQIDAGINFGYLRDIDVTPMPFIIDSETNSSYPNIAYPTNQCFENQNNRDSVSEFLSYKFSCDDGGQIYLYEKTQCNDSDHFPLPITEIPFITADCSGETSCDFVQVTETYYDGDQCNDNFISGVYNAKYAVGVCLPLQDGSDNYFKFLCSDRSTDSYTISIHSDNQCLSDAIIDDEIMDEECIPFLNDTAAVKPSIVGCTSEDEYELIYEDQCVSSQLVLHDNTQEIDVKPTAITGFGPFGSTDIVAKDISTLNDDCNPCGKRDAIKASCFDNTTLDALANTFLYVSQSIYDKFNDSREDCSANNLVVKMQDELINRTVWAVIFDHDVKIPVYQLEDVRKPARIPNIVHQNSANPLDLTNRFSFSCNAYGYPKQICMSTQCVFDAACPLSKYSGKFQSVNDSEQLARNYPKWQKDAYKGVNNIVTIELQCNGCSDQSTDKISLRWVLSDDDGVTGFYCNIQDYDNAATNFDVKECDWNPIGNTETDLIIYSSPFECDEPKYVCISSYQSEEDIMDYVGTYYEIEVNSSIFINSEMESILSRGCECDKNEECSFKLEADCTKQWQLYNPNNNVTMAFCKGTTISYNEQQVESCNDWFIWNGTEYIIDNSFDVDIDECGTEPTPPPTEEYVDELCFELNNSVSMRYSQAQYLWGLYEKVQDEEYDGYPYYQNVRLENTVWNTYLIYYDPKDAWILFTPWPDTFDSSETAQVIDNIVGFCDEETYFPSDCSVGWQILDILFADIFTDANGTEIYSYLYFTETYDEIMNETETNSSTQYIESSQCIGISNIDDYKTEEIGEGFDDICMTFDCQLDDDDECAEKESGSQIVDEYFTVSFCYDDQGDYEDSNMTNSTETGETEETEEIVYYECEIDNDCKDGESCANVDANSIYGKNAVEQDTEDGNISRSSWTHRSNGRKLTLYYDEIRRFWVWKEEDGDLTAWCLKWTDNDPTNCDEFFYLNDTGIDVVSTLVKDCTLTGDAFIDWAGWITFGLIGTCCLAAMCVFVCCYYKDSADKKHARKRRRSEAQIAASVPLTTPSVQEEEEDQTHPLTTITISTAEINKTDDDTKEEEPQETQLQQAE